MEEQIRSVPRRNGNQPAPPPGGLFQKKTEGNGGHPAGGGNGSQTATPKQVSFLISLGARNKLTYADLVRVAQERFQVPDLYQLTKQAASQLIDELKPAGSPR